MITITKIIALTLWSTYYVVGLDVGLHMDYLVEPPKQPYRTFYIVVLLADIDLQVFVDKIRVFFFFFFSISWRLAPW